MSRGYTLSDAADRDLIEIWFYAFQFEQSDLRADDIIDGLYESFALLAKYPRTGTPRKRLGGDTLVFAKGDYVIAYRRAAPGIEISRITGGDEDILHDL